MQMLHNTHRTPNLSTSPKHTWRLLAWPQHISSKQARNALWKALHASRVGVCRCVLHQVQQLVIGTIAVQACNDLTKSTLAGGA